MRQTRHLIVILFLLLPGLLVAGEAGLPLHIGVDDFSTRTLGRESHDGHVYLIVQAEARNGRIAEAIGYCRLRAWVDLQDRKTRKVLLLDRNDETLKTIRFSAFRQYEDGYRAGRMAVTDHQNGQTTVFELDGLANPLTLI